MVFLLALLLSITCTDLRILTYNIRHCDGMDNKVDVDRIAKVINEQTPDIVSIQEVDKGCVRSLLLDEPKLLAEKTGMEYIFGKAIDYDHGEYGDLMLYKSSLNLVTSRKIPLPGDEMRQCIFATFEYDKIKMDFITTHLALNDIKRLHSVIIIENELIANSTADVHFIAGDLNAQPKSPTCSSLEKLGWIDTNVKKEVLHTFSTKNPYEQIDFVYLRPKGAMKYEIEGLRVVNDTAESKIASDHFPLFVLLNDNF